MKSRQRKMQWAGALAVLMMAALLVSCKSFFVDPTLSSFVISPTTPTVPLNGTTQLHAFGTNTDGSSAGDVTSKVTWSSKAPGTISVTTGGLLTGVALSNSTVEIDASYQALTQQTTNASVCVEGIISGSFVIVPSSTNISSTAAFPNGGITASVGVTGITGAVDITSGIQWSTSSTDMTIANGTSPAAVTLTAVTTNTPVTVTATYTCNGTVTTQTTVLTLTP